MQPPYASNIIFELHQDDNDQTQYYVMVKYNGEYQQICEGLSQCPYSFFKQTIESTLASPE